jgi:hypothetical protein
MLLDATLQVPASLMTLLSAFAPLFTAPSFRTFCGLACGFLAPPGKRTVCGMLTGAGLLAECSASAVFAALYSLTNPRPTEASKISPTRHRHRRRRTGGPPRPGTHQPAGRSSVPMQACCCPARPMFKVVMPPTATRPHPVDLWLCGHHYRASQAALKSAGAQVYPLATAAHYAIPADAPVGVSH